MGVGGVVVVEVTAAKAEDSAGAAAVRAERGEVAGADVDDLVAVGHLDRRLLNKLDVPPCGVGPAIERVDTALLLRNSDHVVVGPVPVSEGAEVIIDLDPGGAGLLVLPRKMVRVSGFGEEVRVVGAGVAVVGMPGIGVVGAHDPFGLPR